MLVFLVVLGKLTDPQYSLYGALVLLEQLEQELNYIVEKGFEVLLLRVVKRML